jgi:hypothetical protein
MPAKISIPAGSRFARLVVLREDPQSAYGRIRWICQCDCGTVCSVASSPLRTGRTNSCGCWQRVAGALARRTHGLTEKVPEYQVWLGMRGRCLNQNIWNYHKYGGRGITICPEWGDFARFYADMGPRPSPKHSIDRVDNDGPYAKANCRWATATEQVRNRSITRRYVSDGLALTLKEWAEKTGISKNTLGARIFRQGWSIERALTPVPLSLKRRGKTLPDCAQPSKPSPPAS